jgi:tetratricopeptide (TPR) repeat protein
MKKILLTFSILSVFLYFDCPSANAGFKEHYDLAQSYYTQYQYTSAIDEFRKALAINYFDNSARTSLVNSYFSRAAEYANNDKDYSSAANDYRSALFYLEYYATDVQKQRSAPYIQPGENYLSKCLNAINFDTSAQNRYNTALKLRADGNFSAAGYEFMQALESKSLQKDSFEHVANIMETLGNKPKALEYYKKAIAVAPKDLKLRFTYAKLLDNQKYYEEASNEYNYLIQRLTKDDDSDLLYSLENLFTKKLEESPNNANYNANMGVILQKQGKLDDALKYYKIAEKIDSNNITTRINTGTLYQQKGDYNMAIQAYNSVLIVEPNNINANLYRAQCYELLGENKVAQDGFKKVLALDPNNEYIKSKMLANAKKTLDKQAFVDYVNTNMLEMNPSEIFYDYALELHKNNKLSDAIFMYNAAIKSGVNDAEVYVNLALAQAQQNNYDGALATLNSVKSKYSSDKTVMDTMNNILNMKNDSFMKKASDAYNNNDYKSAIQYYSSVNPATVNSVLGIATSYQQLEDKDKAIEYYKKALNLKPLDSDIAYYIACLYGEKEDYVTAKEYLQKSVAYNKNNTQAIEYLSSIEEADRSNLLNDAISLYDENKFDESLVKFNELLSKDKQNSYAYYYRGMIYDSKEKRNEAISDLKKAYELNKEFSICNYLIASDYDTMEKYKDAYKYYLAYANSDVEDDEYKQYAKARAEELKEYAK